MNIRDMAASDLESVHRLLSSNGWADRVGDLRQFSRLISASQRAVVAEKGGKVIGFARAITDGISNGYLSMVVVDQANRRQGVGQALVEDLTGTNPNMTWVLRAGRDGAPEFFARLGFVASTTAMERCRA